MLRVRGSDHSATGGMLLLEFKKPWKDESRASARRI